MDEAWLALSPSCDDEQRWQQTNRGEPASAREPRAATLYSVGPAWGPDHEAAMRFSSEAPRQRAHSHHGVTSQAMRRVATTSDRHQRPAAPAQPDAETVFVSAIFAGAITLRSPACARRLVSAARPVCRVLGVTPA